MTLARLTGKMAQLMEAMEQYIQTPRTASQLRTWAVIRSIPAAGSLRMTDELIRLGKARRAFDSDADGIWGGALRVGPAGEWPSAQRLPRTLGPTQGLMLEQLLTGPRTWTELGASMNTLRGNVPYRLLSLEEAGAVLIDREKELVRLAPGWDEPVKARLAQRARPKADIRKSMGVRGREPRNGART